MKPWRCWIGRHVWAPWKRDPLTHDPVSNLLVGNSKRVCRACGKEDRANLPRFTGDFRCEVCDVDMVDGGMCPKCGLQQGTTKQAPVGFIGRP